MLRGISSCVMNLNITSHFLLCGLDEFAGIPKTSPTLGLEAGHNRRNLATARKIRPPSQTKENQQVSKLRGYVTTWQLVDT